MESFEHEGAFWLHGQQGRAVAGRLIYSPTEGTSLTLFGSLVDINERLSAEVAPIRLNGAAGKMKLTLDDCQYSGTNIQAPGIERHTYRVRRVLAGAQLGPDDKLAFDEVAVGFDHLQDWVGRSGFSLEFDTTEPKNLAMATQVRIKYDVPPDEVVQVDSSELSLTFSWSVDGDFRTQGNIGQETHFKIKYPELRSLDDILVDVSCLQDLITLAADAPTVLAEVQLWRPDVVHKVRPDEQRPAAVNLYAAFIAEHVRQESRQAQYNMFFPFEQIGGLEVVGRWLTISRKYRPVLAILLTIRYAARLYVENRYYNVISAAETFHRMRFPKEVMPRAVYRSRRRKLVRTIMSSIGRETGTWLNEQLTHGNEPRLRARLLELAKYAGPIFGWLVGDLEPWAKTVTNARNRLTHHDANRQLGVDYTGLYFLADSLYVLVMLCLFRECEISDEALARIKNAQRILLLKEQLEGVLS
jgi:hypothetical protein